MANRNFRSQFSYSYAGQAVTLRAKVSFASGVPSIASGSGMGIASMVRNSAGDISITLSDPYQALLMINQVVQSGNAAPAAPIMSIRSDAVSILAAPVVRIQLRNAAGTLTDPADTEIMHLEIVLNSSSTGY